MIIRKLQIKIFIFIIGCLCLSSSDVYSQRKLNVKNERKRIEKNNYRQRFSFYQKLNILKSQVDGDNLSGFDKWGFEISPGIHYRSSKNLYIKIGLHYNRIGSRKKNPHTELPTEGGIQLDLDLNTLGVDFGIMIKPDKKKFYFSPSLIFNNITSYESQIYPLTYVVPSGKLFDTVLKKQYFSSEVVFGFQIMNNTYINFGALITFSNLLRESYLERGLLKPYHISMGFTYHLVP